MIKGIVFDFDGVIISSEAIKQQALERIFSEYGEDVPHDAIHSARKDLGIVDRTVMIPEVLRRAGKGSGEEQARSYTRRYKEQADDRIRALTVDPRTREALEALSRRFPLYINSATPDEPLKETVRALDLEKYFKDVFGANRPKIDHLRTIAEREGLQPREMLFIGDGEGDLRAAKEFGCDFVGVATELNGWAGRTDIKLIHSVAELEGTLSVL